MSEHEETTMLPFRERLTLPQRISERARLRLMYPMRIPVIVERRERTTPRSNKEKFLLHEGALGGELMAEVRRRTEVDAKSALFFSCGGQMVTGTTEMRYLYDVHRDPSDGFLYVQYGVESTFGGETISVVKTSPAHPLPPHCGSIHGR